LAGAAIPFAWCFLLGTILAPTDAVAVDTLIRRVPLPPALRDVISGESLFNDGTAVVIFLAAVALIHGQSGVVGHGRLLSALVVDCVGGAAIGAIAGFLARLALRWSRDEIVSLTISIALALSTYRLAGVLGVSGPIAVVVAGLVLVSASGKDGQPARWREHLGLFWSLIDDLVNTLLFLLMGVELLALDLGAFAAAVVVAAVPLALVSRAASVALPLAFRPMAWRDKALTGATLTWVGLRGPVSVALVMVAPDGPYTATITAAAYAVVIATIVGQGLTTPFVLGRIYGEMPEKAK
jgi:monovalent cation:H+ antiporter, CPA1 family